MHRKLRTLIALAAVGAAIPGSSLAADPGDVGVFFDQGGTQTSISDIGAFEQFPMYVLAFSTPGGIAAYEFFLDIPATAILPMPCILPAPMECDFGGNCGPENFIVGTGDICLAALIQPLASYPAVMFLSAPGPNVPICLSGAHPSSFPNGEPGYLVCHAPGDIRNFGRAYAGCAMINCTNCDAVPAEALSFGAVKARF